ncbi:BTAD domain-containing putative transcriptional regulator [Amycolatopsis sp. 195334CR]|uniref:AfsR/SARP family transcriptional regulator n=1 Tax=Amycolatopsis sp. 195334CR TaxID=2814588 RepID=UPI001A8BF940|nr:BTAD domain-containing putative transcriptional regulator [Amycolatopsis sp. 195334CR]MBN6039077.1 winged helix-turn-helix domain-containing protein [Amycolatopsis sp. 195334CR]
MLFHTLGPLEVRGRDGEVHRLGNSKAATLLATLLRHPNAWLTSAKLIEATWQDAAAPASAESNLKTYVWQLRRALPEGAARIESAPGRYRLRLGHGELDTQHVAERATVARAATATGDFDTAVAAYETALGWWRGVAFEGLPMGCAAEEFAELRGQLREELADAQLALGRTGDAARTLRALTEDDPLRETAWASLVRALHALGRRAEAVRAYRQASQALSTELGVRPGRALNSAYLAALEPARPRRELPRDTPWFTGRTADLHTIRRATGVVLIDGQPGIGKSALAVHAAHTLAGAFPDGQLFLDLHGSTRPLTAFDALGTQLSRIGVPAALLPGTVDERAALWRCELAHRRVLLVLDDAEGPGQVAPLLPAGRDCRTLITTRSRGWHVDGAVRIGLGPLSTSDAFALVRAATGEPIGEALLALCGGIPAALRDVSTSLCTRPPGASKKLATPCQVFGCAGDGYRHALATAFASLSPAGRSALHALGDLPGEFASADAVHALGGTPDAVRRTLEALVDVGVLDALPHGRYRGHRLVYHYAGCRECAPASATAVARVA